MNHLRNPNSLDRQLERGRTKPGRHPYRRLAELVCVLFALGAGLFVVGLVGNPVPVPSADHRVSSTIVPGASGLVSTDTASSRPEHWSVHQASTVVNGRSVNVGIVDDPRVLQMVRTDFVADYRWLFTTGWHADYSATVSIYFSDAPANGPDTAGMLSGVRSFLGTAASQAEFVQVHVVDNSLEKNMQIFDFSSDGLTAHVSTVVNGKSQRWTQGPPPRLLNETPIQTGTRLFYTLVYDLSHRRWKIVYS